MDVNSGQSKNNINLSKIIIDAKPDNIQRWKKQKVIEECDVLDCSQ